MIITPSILTHSASDVFTQIEKLLPFFNYFQIDIADGRYVQNTTVQIAELLSFIKSHPFHSALTDSFFDFHLMTLDYEKDINLLAEAKGIFHIKNIFIHIDLEPPYERIRQTYPEYAIGLVFNPSDDVEFFSSKYQYPSLDVVQVMSVIPGKQGQIFIPKTLQKCIQLRTKGYRNKIFLDGGINDETLPVIFNSKTVPDGIGPGSYLSKAENIADRVDELKELFAKAGIYPVLKV